MGQEKDPETGWEAFELRIACPAVSRNLGETSGYDGRVGRWMTTDPYSQYHSPYLAMGNNPISRIDPDGGIDEFTATLNSDGGWEYTKISNLGDDEFDVIHYGSYTESGAFSGFTQYDFSPSMVGWEAHPQRDYYGYSDAIQVTDSPIDFVIGGGGVKATFKGLWALGKGGYKMVTSIPKMTKSMWHFRNKSLSKSAAATIKGGGLSKGEKLARKLKMSYNSPTTRQVLDNSDETVESFVSMFRKSSIRSQLPEEYLNMTVEQALRSGNTTVRKLLTDNRFVK